jgi:hypothetical protein
MAKFQKLGGYMFRLSGMNGVFGFKHRTSEQAERAKDDYIKDFARGRASLIQRKYESGNMRLLESEAIDMAIEELKREISIVQA